MSWSRSISSPSAGGRGARTVLLIIGAAWVAAAWWLVTFAPATTAELAQVAGAVLLLTAVVELFRGFALPAHRWLHAGLAVAGAGLSVLALTSYEALPVGAGALTGLFLLIRGVADLGTALLMQAGAMRSLLLIVGAAEALLGVWVAGPFATAPQSLIATLGGLALLRGVADLMTAICGPQPGSDGPRQSGWDAPDQARGQAYAAGTADFAATARRGARHRAHEVTPTRAGTGRAATRRSDTEAAVAMAAPAQVTAVADGDPSARGGAADAAEMAGGTVPTAASGEPAAATDSAPGAAAVRLSGSAHAVVSKHDEGVTDGAETPVGGTSGAEPAMIGAGVGALDHPAQTSGIAAVATRAARSGSDTGARAGTGANGTGSGTRTRLGRRRAAASTAAAEVETSEDPAAATADGRSAGRHAPGDDEAASGDQNAAGPGASAPDLVGPRTSGPDLVGPVAAGPHLTGRDAVGRTVTGMDVTGMETVAGNMAAMAAGMGVLGSAGTGTDTTRRSRSAAGTRVANDLSGFRAGGPTRRSPDLTGVQPGMLVPAGGVLLAAGGQATAISGGGTGSGGLEGTSTAGAVRTSPPDAWSAPVTGPAAERFTAAPGASDGADLRPGAAAGQASQVGATTMEDAPETSPGMLAGSTLGVGDAGAPPASAGLASSGISAPAAPGGRATKTRRTTEPGRRRAR